MLSMASRALSRRVAAPAARRGMASAKPNQISEEEAWMHAYKEIGYGSALGVACGEVWMMYAWSDKSATDEWYRTHNSDCSSNGK